MSETRKILRHFKPRDLYEMGELDADSEDMLGVEDFLHGWTVDGDDKRPVFAFGGVVAPWGIECWFVRRRRPFERDLVIAAVEAAEIWSRAMAKKYGSVHAHCKASSKRNREFLEKVGFEEVGPGVAPREGLLRFTKRGP